MTGETFERWCDRLGRVNRLSRSFAALRATFHGDHSKGRRRGRHAEGPAAGLVETIAEGVRKKPRNNPMQSRVRAPRAALRRQGKGILRNNPTQSESAE